MRMQRPTVSGDAVYSPELPNGGMRLDTGAWFAWLEAPTTTSFSYPLFDPVHGYVVGFMTVRKEGRQRGGAYWSVFRRSGGRIRKVYLGRSATVTQARLHWVADRLRHTPEEVCEGGQMGITNTLR